MPSGYLQQFGVLGGGGGGGDVTELLEADTLSQTFVNITAGTTNIPAGAYHVRVYNTGLEPITANGATVPIGQTWEINYRENRATTRVDFCPAVAIVVPAGGNAGYQVEFPST